LKLSSFRKNVVHLGIVDKIVKVVLSSPEKEAVLCVENENVQETHF